MDHGNGCEKRDANRGTYFLASETISVHIGV